MNVSFDDPFRDTITASDTACGTITVTEDEGTGGGNNGGGSGGGSTPEPGEGDIGIPDSPAVLGGIGLLVLIVVALLVI